MRMCSRLAMWVNLSDRGLPGRITSVHRTKHDNLEGGSLDTSTVISTAGSANREVRMHDGSVGVVRAVPVARNLPSAARLHHPPLFGPAPTMQVGTAGGAHPDGWVAMRCFYGDLQPGHGSLMDHVVLELH